MHEELIHHLDSIALMNLIRMEDGMFQGIFLFMGDNGERAVIQGCLPAIGTTAALK
jgi:hypothetical protein